MKCQICGQEGVSRSLPFCGKCIRENFQRIYPAIKKIHTEIRQIYNPSLGISDDGVMCNLCVNRCHILKGKTGKCGVRKNINNKIFGPTRRWAYLDWYHDPLPTNCVADWVCDGSRQYGYKNLAVFYEGCSFNCLFCQNWHYRERKTKTTTEELVHQIDPLTYCICFFGGDPTPFALHSLEVAKRVSERERKIRLCWETNGSLTPRLMRLWAGYALNSGGCIKIDFKTFSKELNIALCGSSNSNTLENIKLVAQYIKKRRDAPILVISTLLIPGYIDEYEIELMAKFLSGIDKSIPWSFLGFYPHFYFSDIGKTPMSQAEQALAIAKKYGLERTHLGNIHLFI